MVCELIFVVNVWLNPCQITYMYDHQTSKRFDPYCHVEFAERYGSRKFKNKSCEEISKIIKEKSND